MREKRHIGYGTALAIAVLSSPIVAQEPAKAPADAIFNDHPSMDKNATVMPAENAEAVRSIFSENPLLDASVARTSEGRWLITGTTLFNRPRHGIRIWSSADGENWESHRLLKLVGKGIAQGDLAERYTAPHLTIDGDDLYIAFADETGCARLAKGSALQIDGVFAVTDCLVGDARSPSLFVDEDGASYLLWAGGMLARMNPDRTALAESPRFLKPDQSLFADHPPPGKDWPIRTHVGTGGATMFRDGDLYYLVSSEVTGRIRTATKDVFMASAPSPYGPFSMRMLALPHGGETSVVRGQDGELMLTYNPACEDSFALFCEQVGLAPLETAPDGRKRQAASVLTENSAVAARRPLVTSETMRDPSVTLGGDGNYYLVGTLDGYGYQFPDGGVKLWQSPDLDSWSELDFIFEWQDMGYEFSNVAELWAPEIKWVESEQTYYLAFSVMERGVGGKTWLYRSTSGTAQGPYENVADSYFVKGIDGFIFEDDDGVYLLWGGGKLGKLNADRSGFEGEVRNLIDIAGDHIGYEGNSLIKVGDTYFVTGAEWHGPLRTHGTYDMMYGTSNSLFGPYTKRRLGAPHGGHGTPFRDVDGQYWYTMFGNDPTAPWRMQFGIIPIDIGDARAIRVPGIDETRD